MSMPVSLCLTSACSVTITSTTGPTSRQWFPTNKLKIEPWIVNGWQSYNKFNGHRGLGGQILYRPYEWLSLVFNNYGNGTDTLGNPNRSRLHTDDSIEVRYFNNPAQQK